MSERNLNSRVLTGCDHCRNCFIDFYGNQEELKETFPSATIYSYFGDRHLERIKEKGVYAEPYSDSDKQTGHYMIKVVDNCPFLEPFGWYRKGMSGGFECTNLSIPQDCAKKFKFK
ncbi:MAG: hypothetical protein US67_C0023G0003 [Candidatus Woesebacteria bacterium GW2011_GWD1_38_10]|uniref:Uncharacterized protein n=2 Tax=Candidatus Woeseibacteriota TaxID=1752722 RepID=A0A0G0L6B2_9BACT|nr:MAG: hypothetical protein US67_C0023G0003 [Candidatus Woesebacteria bacterium GW2011_GWD1_38_10]KKQ75759.1 MAG: hypothetical protein US97_C0033G0002 [Microgenomates group bacterium GW2011_GWF1_38_5]KKQ83390.1 MAG: hypothetical protein UT06_C0023G0054 [Candidatus Woesebacteria bacterium GW2011_GWA1_38_8]